ncbi:hypothetical protein ACLB2K_021330 [Fragaria x ananassa]
MGKAHLLLKSDPDDPILKQRSLTPYSLVKLQPFTVPNPSLKTLQSLRFSLSSAPPPPLMPYQFLDRIRVNGSSSGAPTYLAQHSLFDQINELREDVCVQAWFGPAGTITPLHHDPHHNVFAQVVGKKYIRLYRASLSEELYPHTETMLCNLSQVDLDNIDEKEFPKVQDLEFLDCIF